MNKLMKVMNSEIAVRKRAIVFCCVKLSRGDLMSGESESFHHNLYLLNSPEWMDNDRGGSRVSCGKKTAKIEQYYSHEMILSAIFFSKKKCLRTET